MLRISFRQLEAFYWAATLGTVNAASKHLFLSQPAVTARINELEEILGSSLLNRSQVGVQTTPLGKQILIEARLLLDQGRRLEQVGSRRPPPLDGVLRLGADDSSAAVGMTEILRQLRSRYPSLRIDISVERSKVLHEKLNRRELDVALHTNPVNRTHVQDEFLGKVQVAWIASSRSVLTGKALTPNDAASIPIVMPPQPSILNLVVRDWLGETHSGSNLINTCNSLGTIISLVEDGHAIAALPVPVVMQRIKLETLMLVDSTPLLPAISYYASYLGEKEAEEIKIIVDISRHALESLNFFG